jgi:hypothetical protein
MRGETMSADGRRCATCSHFMPNDDPQADPPLMLENDGQGCGSCRRYPPQLDPVHRLIESIDNTRADSASDDPGQSLSFADLAGELLGTILVQLERTDSAAAAWPRVHETDWCGEYSKQQG